jgi:hypothetical protein
MVMDSRQISDVSEYNFQSEKLKQISPVVAKLKRNNQLDMGIVAQELFKVEPGLVIHYSNGTLDIDYKKLSVMLLAVVKELNARVEALENNLNKKTVKNAKL